MQSHINVQLDQLANELSCYTAKDRYYILDCNGDVCGNPNGYDSVRKAITIANRRNSKAHKHIWKTTREAQHVNPNHSLVYSGVSRESLLKGENNVY